ncbi:type IV pilin protein [Amphritea balenae]|uniref:Type IV pilin protein n=1 Tax=Amphritea balenae TaxID=452629 RepID=A0A3P1SJJ2_9GAMM|nr:type IV pilin protein [Amphritea balenae]RRC97318.1 type IV pilin protein [Amphritea balenae]GGK83446.1 type IV pilin [Amphritea balenae]
MNNEKGFSLLELMIAVAIVGIIAGVAYPSYLSMLQDSRRADGQAALMDLAARQERFFYDQRTYAASIAGLSAPAQSPEGFYNLSIVSGAGCTLPNCFVGVAAATGAQAGDLNLLIDSRGNRKLDADADSIPDAGEEDW